MAASNPPISVDFFTKDSEVINCISELEQAFGAQGKDLKVSDVLDPEGHQYVNLVQKGGGVLGVALVGYTYILEQMNIRFVRLAGTSAGAINTALMTVIGGGDKKKAKSEEILKSICALNFFDLVDGHPVARWAIKNFISNKDFATKIRQWIKWIIITLVALPVLDFIFLGLQHKFHWVSVLTEVFFVITGFFILVVLLLVFYLMYLLSLLKDVGFGINSGDFFYDWIKRQMKENGVLSVSDLMTKASTPVPDLYLRTANAGGLAGLEGDVTFIASELVSENKIEFPKMWDLFRTDKDQLQPAGFVRASMSIPIFFESYYINNIPNQDPAIRKAWLDRVGEDNPPTKARFVDGGILSNFPINLFYNKDVDTPRLPSFGIDLDDGKDPREVFGDKEGKPVKFVSSADIKHDADHWSLGSYILRLFNTVRFYYDKDFLIKNVFFKKGIGVIPLKGFGWLNFFLTNAAKKEMFILGAKSATKFLKEFDWETYKTERAEMKQKLEDKAGKPA